MGVLHRNNVRCPGQNSKMIVVGDGDGGKEVGGNEWVDSWELR